MSYDLPDDDNDQAAAQGDVFGRDLGMWFLPATKAMPKKMLPVVDCPLL